MKRLIDVVVQEKYNKEHNIIPQTIKKEIRDVISNSTEASKSKKPKQVSQKEQLQIMATIEQEMREAAKNLDFERAMELRDILFEMKSVINMKKYKKNIY